MDVKQLAEELTRVTDPRSCNHSMLKSILTTTGSVVNKNSTSIIDVLRSAITGDGVFSCLSCGAMVCRTQCDHSDCKRALFESAIEHDHLKNLIQPLGDVFYVGDGIAYFKKIHTPFFN